MANEYDNLRNQFMSNTNNSRDTIRYDRIPYPTGEFDDEFSFAPIAKHHKPTVNDFSHGNHQTKESFELRDLTYNVQEFPYPEAHTDNEKRDSHPLPPTPKFETHNPFLTPFDNDHDDHHEHDDFIPSKPQPPIPEFDEEKAIRRNERERIHQLKSLPRFHYTRLPYFGMVVTVIQVIVFIVELVKMSSMTGSAFQTKPYFNPMLGPSTYLLINMGARYTPCMNLIVGITNDTTLNYPCPNSTTLLTDVCNLNELCGLGGIPQSNDAWEPHQWYRIITPIFLHAGFLHILFNLLLQVTMGFSIERYIGSLKYAIIYLTSGISGFLLGANFTPNGIASTGCSGSLFGVVATNLLLFIYCGKKNTNLYGTKKFGLFLFVLIGEVVVSFVLGLLPGLDNFSHIGGFAMGILTSLILLKDPYWIYHNGIITYQSNLSTWQVFQNNWNPWYNINDKMMNRWWMWCGVRALSCIMVIIYFVLLIRNFFGKQEISETNGCSWCKYISCLPVDGWCDNGYVEVSDSSNDDSSSSNANESTSPASTGYATMTETYTSAEPTSIENNAFNPRQLLGDDNGFDLPVNYNINGNIGVSLIMIMILYRFLKCRR